MAARIIRNDFVAGEISPELWGRHDIDMYYHGAALCRNFIPRKTGGVRKRAGTEFVWHGKQDDDTEWRVIPFNHNKDDFGFVVLSRTVGAQSVFGQVITHRADGTIAQGERFDVGVVYLSPTEHLSQIKYIQIGDTLFFTLHGHRAFSAKVTFSAAEVEWQQFLPSVKPEVAPDLNAQAVNFKSKSESGYTASSRTYRLWGVKDGILSEPSETRADITLAWVSGAYIDVTFTPDWSKHDYYILGKLLGGQFGEMTRFYPGRSVGARSDTTWQLNASQTRTINGVAYSASSADPSALWTTTDTEEADTNGDALTGTFSERLEATYSKPDAIILSIKLWIGAKMATAGTPTTHGNRVGLGENITVKLYNGTNPDEIASWTISGGYADSSHSLMIQTPATPEDGTYTIAFEDLNGDPVFVPVRGAILCSDSAKLLFHDDNIQPGTLTGEQQTLDVGDTGMDVDIIATWQQRLIAASSETKPFTMWFSTTGDLYNFSAYRPQVPDDAFEATIASTDPNRILHIISQKWLLALTETGEYVIEGSNGVLNYASINVKRTSSVGAHPDIPPVTTESDVIFVASDARSLYRMEYSLERDSVIPTEVTIRAAHITECHRITKIAYQRYPDSVVWCLLDDGSLASLTLNTNENVWAWARHDTAESGLKIVDICSVSSVRSDSDSDTTSDILLVLEDDERPTDIWVERFRPCVVADSTTTAAATCHDHMGYAESDYPTGGDPETRVDARLETLRMDPQQADMIGKQTNAYDTVVRVRRSGVLDVRPTSQERWATSALQPDNTPIVDETDETVALVSRDVKIAPFASQNRESRIEIRSADDWPCEILSMLVMMGFGNQKWGS